MYGHLNTKFVIVFLFMSPWKMAT